MTCRTAGCQRLASGRSYEHRDYDRSLEVQRGHGRFSARAPVPSGPRQRGTAVVLAEPGDYRSKVKADRASGSTILRWLEEIGEITTCRAAAVGGPTCM